jgi:hypothetical protein
MDSHSLIQERQLFERMDTETGNRRNGLELSTILMAKPGVSAGSKGGGRGRTFSRLLGGFTGYVSF